MYEKVFPCIGSFADPRDDTRCIIHAPIGIAIGVSCIVGAAVRPVSRDARTRRTCVKSTDLGKVNLS